jgi:hypothetical protein
MQAVGVGFPKVRHAAFRLVKASPLCVFYMPLPDFVAGSQDPTSENCIKFNCDQPILLSVQAIIYAVIWLLDSRRRRDGRLKSAVWD